VFVISHDSLGAPSAKLSSVPRIILPGKILLCVSGHLLIYAYLFRCLGIEKKKGTLCPGADADLVVLSKQGRVLSTWVKGKQVYAAQSHCP